MPAAVGLGAIEAIALAFVAIGAALLVRTLVVAPIRSASSAVSSVPAIGGALAYVLSQTALAIEIGVNGFAALANDAKSQGLSWWNWSVQVTLQYIDIPQWHALSNVVKDTAAVTALAQYIWYNSLPGIYNSINSIGPAASAAYTLSRSLFYDILPQLRGIDAGLRTDVDAVTRLAQYIWYNSLAEIRGIEAGIRTDLNNAIRQLQNVTTQTIPRIQADVNTRAKDVELQALRDLVNKQAAALATLSALVPIAIAGEEAIQNLRCMMDTPCSDSSLNMYEDLEARVSNLELGEM